jgi:hypothetical protein
MLEGAWAGIGAPTPEGEGVEGVESEEEAVIGWAGYAALPGTWVEAMSSSTLARVLLESRVAEAAADRAAEGGEPPLPGLPEEIVSEMGVAASWQARADFFAVHHLWPQLRALVQVMPRPIWPPIHIFHAFATRQTNSSALP